MLLTAPKERAIESAERDGKQETENHVNGSGQIAENARKMRSEPKRRQNRGDDDNTCKLIKGQARVAVDWLGEGLFLL